jgi:sulfatase maturation enzyme AslB (radical SAM superfamily)
LHDVDLNSWHASPLVEQARNQMADGIWPSYCSRCQTDEEQGLTSVRSCGNQSQATFTNHDISLELRPGATCNFACQTCWPEASSRVVDFYQRAGLIPIKSLDSYAIRDFDWLDPIKHRIKEVVLLGGEPFYDKNCLKFLEWAVDNLTGSLFLFTNGSKIDYNWIRQYKGRLVLIFSLDAVDTVAEYVRFGTHWPTVLENFQLCRNLPNIELRVNITVSVYNYLYLEPLIDLLIADWPSVVSFGYPVDKIWMRQSSVPLIYRASMIQSLQRAIEKIMGAHMPLDQRQNALANIKSTMQSLEDEDFDAVNHQSLKDFIISMDRVKNISFEKHCPELYKMLF